MPRSAVVLLAWRFLTGPPRARGATGARNRLAGAVLGVALSMVPLVVVQQVADGMIAGIADRFIETGSYHLRAVSRGGTDPDATEALAAAVRRIPGVTHAVAERQGFGLLYSDRARSGVQIRAVPQEWWSQDEQVRALISLRGGTFDLSQPEHAVIGTAVADQLGLAVGEEVRLLTVRPLGEGRMLPRVSRFTVTAIISTGYRDLDRLWMFVPRERGRRIIPDETAEEVVGIKVPSPHSLPNPLFNRGLAGVAQLGEGQRMLALTEEVLSQFGGEWYVYDWYAAEEGRYVSFLTSRNLLALVMAMIVVVAVVNISSALVLLVVEKEQEIAILRATGVDGARIARAFVYAGAMIGAGGATLGAAAGLALARYINPLLRLVESVLARAARRPVNIFNPEFYLQEIPVRLHLLPIAAAVFLVLALSVAAAVIPAGRASKIPPDRILRGHTAWSRGTNVID